MPELMVDLETLDTKTSAVVLTLGAVKFDPFNDSPMKELYIKFDIESQESLDCTISNDVIDWWSKQDESVKTEAFSDDNRLDVKDAIDTFHKFAWGCNKFWSKGSCFDIMILEHLYSKLKKTVPWQYWEIRDARTLFDLADPNMPSALLHNALEDARRQAIGVRNIYKKLNYNPNGKT